MIFCAMLFTEEIGHTNQKVSSRHKEKGKIRKQNDKRITLIKFDPSTNPDCCQLHVSRNPEFSLFSVA